MSRTNFLRGGVRLPLELPVEVRWRGRRGKKQHAQGKTVAISGNGFYILLPKRLAHETPIDFTMDLPVELTRVPMKLAGQGLSPHMAGGGFGPAPAGWPVRSL